MFSKPLSYKLISFSLLVGSITSWLIKEEITPLLLGGKNFEARSVAVQIGILITLTVLFSSFFLFLFFFFERRFLSRLDLASSGLVLKVKRIYSAVQVKWFTDSMPFDAVLLKFQLFLKDNVFLIWLLSITAIFAYGFELFNFNITIDEEVYSAAYGPTINWVIQGRWGMYLVNKFILPYTVIPFVPLSVALIFHIAAIFLILESWNVRSKLERAIIGMLSIAFPLMAYIYSFSTINYGIGIGLFCVALSLYIYTHNKGYLRLFAALPAAFAIAIYQGLILSLIGAFLVYVILIEMRNEKFLFNNLITIAGMHILAFLTYYAVQEIIIALGIIRGLGYVSGYFDLTFLFENFDVVVTRMWTYLILPVYFGKESVYAIDIKGFSVLFIVSLLGLTIKLLWSAKIDIIKKTLVFVFFMSLLFLPFVSGLFMQGYMYLRFLVSLPIVIPGIIMLGMADSSRIFKIIVTILTAVSVFQFIMSTNHLFAAAHLSLQADRSLATRLIGRIEDAQSEAGVDELKYIVIVGYEHRPSTMLIPKIETLGVSYFEFAQGNTERILAFLQTLGYSGLKPLPLDEQPQMVDVAILMPEWPKKGSVKVVGDVVLVKFGKYSASQKQVICSSKENREILPQGFCK